MTKKKDILDLSPEKVEDIIKTAKSGRKSTTKKKSCFKLKPGEPFIKSWDSADTMPGDLWGHGGGGISYKTISSTCVISNEDSKYETVGNHIKNMAERKNIGKPQLSMVNLTCLIPCAQVLEFGAKKYSRNNWKKGMPVSQIIDSLLRHISDLQNGKHLDEESKLAIIGHIQCNAMFLGNKNNIDDMCEGNLYG